MLNEPHSGVCVCVCLSLNDLGSGKGCCGIVVEDTRQETDTIAASGYSDLNSQYTQGYKERS